MSWNKWIRQTHRWTSIALVVAIIINGVAVLEGKYNRNVGLLAVAPFAVLLLTGLYLFMLPYAAKWRGARHTT
jgi:heme A synthase